MTHFNFENFLSHIKELRVRLIRCFCVFVAGATVCYIKSSWIFHILALPLERLWAKTPISNSPVIQRASRHFIYTHLTEAFMVYLKIAAFGGFFVAFPYIAFELWRFIAPGLFEKERYVFLLFLVFAPLLFFAGAFFAYTVVVPLAYEFFLSFEIPSSDQGAGVLLQAKIQEYLSLIMRLMIGFGLCFEMPLVLALLARIGVLSQNTLKRQWRMAVVIIFALSAIITPPDLMSMLLLSIPLCCLYGVSIWLVGTSFFRNSSQKEIKSD